jgi:hypothetical protein
MTVFIEQVKKHIDSLEYIAMENGILNIRSRNECQDKPRRSTLTDDEIISALLKKLNMVGYRYQYYSCGKYGARKFAGVCLQFQNLNDYSTAYTIFNAKLSRSRNVKGKKAGTPLKSGRFTVAKNSNFAKFWCGSGLRAPRSWTSIADYMGNLKKITFSASLCSEEKIDKTTLTPLNITHEEILAAFANSSSNIQDSCRTTPSDKSRTEQRHYTDNSRTKLSDKDLSVGPEIKGQQANSTTCKIKHGLSLQGKAVIPPCFNTKRTNQLNKNDSDEVDDSNSITNDEWLEGYCKPNEHKSFEDADLDVF